MKITCGTDIIEIGRIKKSIETLGDSFLNRVFTKDEILYCNGKKNQKYQHFAARFAAKEAAFKAISELLNNKYDISWTDVEINNNDDGKPYLKIYNQDEVIKKIKSMDLSISHCKEYATAVVTALVES